MRYLCGCTENQRPGRTIVTMSTQHIATLLGATCCARFPPCCAVLRYVGCCWLKIWPTSNLSQQYPTCQNMSQAKIGRPVATCWRTNMRNMLRPTVLRYVALTCCDMFGRGLRPKTWKLRPPFFLYSPSSCHGFSPQVSSSGFYISNSNERGK